MKEVKFYKINKENLNLIDDININNEILQKENIENFVNDSKNYLFVGIYENSVIAVSYGYGMTRPDGKAMFYIHSVDVAETYQNIGVGTRLFDFMINYIKDEKLYYKFFVLTENDNIRACKVYQKYADREEQVLFSKRVDEV